MPHIGKKASNIHEDTLTRSDFFTGTVSLVKDEWVKVGDLEVGAQERRGFGFGHDGSDRVGRVLIDMQKDAGGGNSDGFVRLIHSDANEETRQVVYEARTEDLRLGDTDPRLRKVLTAKLPRVGEDSKLIVEMKGDAADTLGDTDCKWRIPSYRETGF